MALTALYDACVLYPAPLRDLLMRLATTGLFRARWTNQIHEQWIRNLLADRPDLTRAQLERARDLMNAHVSDCLIEGYEGLVAGLGPIGPDGVAVHPGDRSVFAAAIAGRVDVIVTFNLRHFPAAALGLYGMEAQDPDDFILHLLDLDEATVLAAVRRQRLALRAPPIAAEGFLDTLARQRLPKTVASLRFRRELI